MSEHEELLTNILSCFHRKERDWYYHKTNDAEWVPVSEDLHDYLEEASEVLLRDDSDPYKNRRFPDEK